MSFWRTKNSKKITSDSIAVKNDGTTLKDFYNKIESKAIATLKPSADLTFTPTGNYTSNYITNLSIYTSKGNKISVNQNGRIALDSSIKYVKVSGCFCLNNTATGIAYTLSIGNIRNDTWINSVSSTQQINQAWNNMVYLTPIIIPIEEGDVLAVAMVMNEGANKTGRIKAQYTYVAIEEV